MNKGIFLVAVLLVVSFSSSSVFSREISLGEMRFINLSPTQVISVYFKQVEGRACVVNIRALYDGREVLSKNVKLDKARGEEYIYLENKKITLFHVVKGVIILLDGEEV